MCFARQRQKDAQKKQLHALGLMGILDFNHHPSRARSENKKAQATKCQEETPLRKIHAL